MIPMFWLADYVGFLDVTSDFSAYLGYSSKFKIQKSQYPQRLLIKGHPCLHCAHLGDNHLANLSWVDCKWLFILLQNCCIQCLKTHVPQH